MIFKIKQNELAQPDWLILDDLIMEKIFEILSVGDRFNASLVCEKNITLILKILSKIVYDSLYICNS